MESSGVTRVYHVITVRKPESVGVGGAGVTCMLQECYERNSAMLIEWHTYCRKGEDKMVSPNWQKTRLNGF